MAAAESEASYIDYEAFASPDFHAPSFANTLVLSTNDANDTSIDLSTPLSRVLFDVQEVDTHIDSLTTSSALPLIKHTSRDYNKHTQDCIKMWWKDTNKPNKFV
ncbi:MAG: Succinyl-CoA:3-ketoacid-coenzyme A transferase [Aureobasidium pullulans]|nr:MAG: Succinyl-CoA:3-ketoacid-coenzyme A transferase [Aureobasidium pullulans]